MTEDETSIKVIDARAGALVLSYEATTGACDIESTLTPDNAAWVLRSAADSLAPLSDGAAQIAAERQRQIDVEGWTPDHDDDHTAMELTMAAVSYANMAFGQVNIGCAEGNPIDDEPTAWPWDMSWWKPSPDPIRNLVRAGALVAAEIDRLLRDRE